MYLLRMRRLRWKGTRADEKRGGEREEEEEEKKG